MTTPSIQTPSALMTQLQPYASNANEMIEQARRASITSAEDFAKATDFIKICSAQIKKAEDVRTGLVGPLNDHVKWINAQFKPVTEALKTAKAEMETKGGKWKREEDARIRAAAEAERKRIEEEALKEAAAAEKAGDKELANAMIESVVDLPDAPKAAPNVRGDYTGATGFTADRWTGSVANIVEVCAAIGAGKLPADLVMVKQVEINKLSKELQRDGLYHGLHLVKETNMRVR